MSRISRVCAVNYPHHITQRGNNKDTVFFDNEDREFYMRTLAKYAHKWSLEIWAYCLMTNHLHILAVPKKVESLARGMGVTNLVYTQYINNKYKRSGRLWQNRFYSTVIEEEPYLWAVVRYMERNPVRAKLVDRAEDYQWSSAKAHLSMERNALLSENDWLGGKNLKAYRNFFKDEDGITDSLIRKSTSTGRPLGGEQFLKGLEKLIGRRLIAKKAGRPRKRADAQRK